MLNKRRFEINIGIILLTISAVCLITHFLFFRYSFPPVNVDEASFFSPAYSLAKHGVLSSDVHQSFLPGASRFTYWMPPLYLFILGYFLKLMGVTILNGKILSIIFTCVSAFTLASISKDRYIKLSAAALFLICPFIIITSAFIRVEALAILLIIFSIVAVKYHSSEYLLGIIAGLGIMTHPLLMPVAAGLALVMITRGIKPFLFFSLIVLVIITPYLFYIFKDVELFKEQMILQFSRKSKAHFSDLKLSYILQCVPFALAGLFCLYKINHAKELRLFLAACIIMSLFVILRSNEFNYQVYLIPYVLAALIIVMEERKESQTYRFVFPLLFYGLFTVLLLSKMIKYHWKSDKEYKEMITYLNNNKSWNGKEIFVTGSPDVASYFLMNNQHVERQIPIAVSKSKDWLNKYNYIVEVKDNVDKDQNISPTSELSADWESSGFTTSGGSNSLIVFIRK